MESSKRAQEEGCTHARIGFAQKSIAMTHVASVYTALHLWGLHKSQGCFWNTPWGGVGDHRQRGNTTGHPLTKNYAMGYGCLVDRQYRWPTSHNFLQKPVLTTTEDRQGMAMHFKANVCTTNLPIMLWTQGSMVLDPRTTNHAFQCMMAQEAKVCNFNM